MLKEIASKRRVKRAMRALEEAMEAERTFVARRPDGDKVITTPDHRIRLMAVGILGSFYGLEADKSTRVTMAGDPDSPLLINVTDRRYIESLIEHSDKS